MNTLLEALAIPLVMLFIGLIYLMLVGVSLLCEGLYKRFKRMIKNRSNG